MPTAEECLRQAESCEELAERLKSYGGGASMLQAAQMWRRLAAGLPVKPSAIPPNVSLFTRPETDRPSSLAPVQLMVKRASGSDGR